MAGRNPGWWRASNRTTGRSPQDRGSAGFHGETGHAKLAGKDTSSRIHKEFQIQMRTTDPRRLWLFPLAAILTAVPWVFLLGPGRGQHEQAVSLASASYRAPGYVYFAGLICLLLAVVTLVATAEAKRPSAWALAALVFDISAVTMITAVFGILTLADPVVASYYLSGHEDVGALLRQLSGGSFAASINAWFAGAMGIGVIGAVATAVSSWRAGIGRWSAVLVAAGLVLALLIQPLVSWVGSALLLGAGGWIAWHANSRNAAERTSDLRLAPTRG